VAEDGLRLGEVPEQVRVALQRGRAREGLHRAPVVAEHVAHRAVGLDHAIAQPDGPLADRLDRLEVVGDEHHGGALGQHRPHAVETLLLEGGVADGQDLVDQQDVGLRLDHHRECETDEHARRIVLELQVDELLELGEVEHCVQTMTRLPL